METFKLEIDKITYGNGTPFDRDSVIQPIIYDNKYIIGSIRTVCPRNIYRDSYLEFMTFVREDAPKPNLRFFWYLSENDGYVDVLFYDDLSLLVDYINNLPDDIKQDWFNNLDLPQNKREF